METLESIKNRRSIRSFKSKEISKDIIEDILNCGRLAPSAKNRQPWYFVIVKDKIKNEIADMMTKNSNNQNLSEKTIFNSSVNPTANVIKEASILILVFREKNKSWIVGDNLSIGACIENMCLRATELNLGTLWIRDIVYVSEEVAKMLNHEELELNSAVALGYPNEFPKARPRKELKDIVEWYN